VYFRLQKFLSRDFCTNIHQRSRQISRPRHYKTHRETLHVLVMACAMLVGMDLSSLLSPLSVVTSPLLITSPRLSGRRCVERARDRRCHTRHRKPCCRARPHLRACAHHHHCYARHHRCHHISKHVTSIVTHATTVQWGTAGCAACACVVVQ
jgi:hypothetical protein